MDIHVARLTIACWSLLTLCVAVRCSPVYPNINFLSKPNFEPMCTKQQERFIESDGKESSLMLEFNPESTQDSCMRILSAPEFHGFIVRLIRPKLRKSFHNAHAGPPPKGFAAGNTTRTCPLQIFSSLDPQIPSWQVDPCQLEDSSLDKEDPVKLFQGRLRLVWEHNGHTLSSKLMITVLGKGEACTEPDKHPCLKIGEEPLLCISKALVCDRIRHCPYSNEYDSDEDSDMCWKSKQLDDGIESEILEHWAIEIFRNLFAFDVPPPNSGTNNTKSSTENADPNDKNKTHNGSENTGNGSGYTRRNSTRLGLNSDLSKYGPWGYLMLGMLLCGGALLICGLWASASQSAHNDSDASMQQGNITIEHQVTPPNYEELDPPPPYSVLFPNQKAVTPETEATPVTSAAAATAQQPPESTSSEPNTSSTPTTTEITAS